MGTLRTDRRTFWPALCAAGVAVTLAVITGCGGVSEVLHGRSPCTPEMRAVFRDVPAIGGRTPPLQRIPGSDECGYYLHIRTSPRAVYHHYQRALVNAGWKVIPPAFTDPCEAHPVPAGAVCGGGPLLSAHRGELRYTLEYERGEGTSPNIYIVAMSPAPHTG